MSYQQARAIRNMPSLSNLILQRSLAGQGFGSAVGGAIKQKLNVSQRLRAKVVGIKEKFDPLNIAKFLTGGSSLAPALLGRMLGRSDADINYFAGRPIRNNRYGDMITPVPREDNTGGIVSGLKKLYKLMNKSNEREIRYRELMINRQEERDIEDERRHKELIAALGGQTSGGETATKVVEGKSGGMFDDIKKVLEEVFKRMSDMASTIKNALSEILSLKNMMKIVSAFGDVLRALGVAVTVGAEMAAGALVAIPGGAALLLLLPWMLQAGIRERIRQDPNAPGLENNPTAMKERQEYKTENAAAEANRSRTVKKFRRNEIEEFANSTLTNDVVREATGKDKEELKQWLNDNPTLKEFSAGAKTSKVFEGPNKTKEYGTSREDAARARSIFNQNDPRLIKIEEPDDNKGKVLNSVTKENIDAKIDSKMNQPESTQTLNNNVTNTNTAAAQPKVIPPVRNLEPTYSSILFDTVRLT